MAHWGEQKLLPDRFTVRAKDWETRQNNYNWLGNNGVGTSITILSMNITTITMNSNYFILH